MSKCITDTINAVFHRQASSSGYIEFPGGIILAWGGCTTGTDGSDTFYIPIALSSYYVAQATAYKGTAIMVGCAFSTPTQFEVTNYLKDGTGCQTPCWGIVIGQKA